MSNWPVSQIIPSEMVYEHNHFRCWLLEPESNYTSCTIISALLRQRLIAFTRSNNTDPKTLFSLYLPVSAWAQEKQQARRVRVMPDIEFDWSVCWVPVAEASCKSSEAFASFSSCPSSLVAGLYLNSKIRRRQKVFFAIIMIAVTVVTAGSL